MCDGLAGQLASLLLVDEEDADALHDLEQSPALTLDPVVDGVAEDEAGILELLQHLALQHGVDVGEKDVRARAQALVKLGPEPLEHVELRAARLTRVLVVVVIRRPPEGLPFLDLETRQVQVWMLELTPRLGGEILT